MTGVTEPVSRTLPSRARVVVVGGGVGGTSVAYHLALAGERDVVLVDRDELTSGSTFHSAGLVGQLRSDPTLTAMNRYSVELYRSLQQGDNPPGWVECGSIRLASSQERWEEIRRQEGWAASSGLDMSLISADEAKDLFPLMSTDGVVGGCFLPTDGQVDPAQLTYSLAAAARGLGVRIHPHTRVLGIGTEGEGLRRHVTRVRTDRGDIECELVVDCGGMFAAEIARMVDVRVPIVPMSHQYVVTEAMFEHRETPLPSLRDPDNLVYYRQEVDGLVMGGYERRSLPWTASPSSFDDIPADFNGRLLPPDHDRFVEISDNATLRVPAIADAGIRTFVNGPEAFTPDNEFCLGPTDVAGFFVAAGFCAHGIAGAGGIGKVMAEWVLEGAPPMDLWHMDVRRFGGSYRSPSYTLARTVENYESYYDIRYPAHERQAGRPLRTSPAYAWHAEHGASFGEKSGWERVNHYESNSHVDDEGWRPQGWAGRHWAPAVVPEHRAARETAATVRRVVLREDRGERPGRDPSDAVGVRQRRRSRRGHRDLHAGAQRGRRDRVRLHRHPARRRAVPRRHGYGVREPRRLVAADPGQAARRRRAHHRRHRRVGVLRVVGPEGTRHRRGAHAAGPRQRRVPVPRDARDDGRRRPGAHGAGDVRRRARLGDVLPHRVRRHLCGARCGTQVAGTASSPAATAPSTRCAWRRATACGARTSTPRHTPYEAGLGFCVRLGKAGGFLGREALLAQKEAGLTQRLVCLVLDDRREVALGNEPVRLAAPTAAAAAADPGPGDVLGRVTSGGVGYTLGVSIAFAYLPVEHAVEGTRVEVGIFGEWVGARVTTDPLYDPRSERVRA